MLPTGTIARYEQQSESHLPRVGAPQEAVLDLLRGQGAPLGEGRFHVAEPEVVYHRAARLGAVQYLLTADGTQRAQEPADLCLYGTAGGLYCMVYRLPFHGG